MDLGLKGKVAIITGGSEGIGKAAAQRMAEEGAKVVIVARRPEVLKAAAEDIQKATNGTVLPVQGDVADPATIERVVQTTMDQLGRIDLLVNNAGGYPPMPFLETDESSWEWCMRFNVTQAANLTRLALPHMLAKDGGAVLNISSAAGRIVRKNFAAYGTAKRVH